MKKELIELRVNGRTHELAVQPNSLLLDVLRQDLELTGSKRGCDDSSCGACTVQIDGVPMLACTMLAARLPAAGLRFRRELRLHHNESVVYVEERVANERAQDHFFHWTEHVTLGLPLLHPDESIIALPGTRAITWPHGYEGASLVRDNQEFTWPEAPAIEGGMVDLARPFARDGKGFVVGVLLDPQRKLGFVAALNWQLGLLLG